MNEKEVRQKAHDMKVIEKAVHDAAKKKFDPPGGNSFIEGMASAATFGLFSDAKTERDRKTYKAAHDEAKKKL